MHLTHDNGFVHGKKGFEKAKADLIGPIVNKSHGL